MSRVTEDSEPEAEEHGDDKLRDHQNPPAGFQHEQSCTVTSVPIMLPSGARLGVEGQFPLSESDFDYVVSLLRVLKPGWVAQQRPGPDADEDE